MDQEMKNRYRDHERRKEIWTMKEWQEEGKWEEGKQGKIDQERKRLKTDMD